MDLLLDTHVLLWWDQDDHTLSRQARKAIADSKNQVFVSAISPWELAIKARIGKLRFEGSAASMIEANGFRPLPILPSHGEAAGMLEWEHADPFDRMLVAQAQAEGLVLVHADENIRRFRDVTQLWAR